MDEVQKEAVKKMIAAELAGGLPAVVPPGARPETASQPAQAPQIKQEPAYPSEVSLDEYEALLVDALQWRIEASEKTQVILNNEKNNITRMKRDLLARCARRLGVDLNSFNLMVNSGTKTVQIEKRG